MFYAVTDIIRINKFIHIIKFTCIIQFTHITKKPHPVEPLYFVLISALLLQSLNKFV